MVRLRACWVHDPDVGILSSAPRRAIGNAAIEMSLAGTGVARLAIRQQRDFAVGQVVAVELEPLAAASVFAEDEIIALGAVVRSANTVRKEGELAAVATGHFHAMDLLHVGKTRGNSISRFTGSQSCRLAPRNSPY